MIFVAIVLGSAAILIWFASYAVGVWFLGTHHLVDLSSPQAVEKLLPLIPPAVATVVTAASAVTTAVVALINRKAQIDLAGIQHKYVQELAEKKLGYDKELEEKKKKLLVDLEREKIQFDILKSDQSRQLDLISRATLAMSRYAVVIRQLRRGVFTPDKIEEQEQEIRHIAAEWERGSELFKAWQLLLNKGIYLKERAEKKSTPEGWMDVWKEKGDAGSLGVEFGGVQEAVISELCRMRERVLTRK